VIAEARAVHRGVGAGKVEAYDESARAVWADVVFGMSLGGEPGRGHDGAGDRREYQQ
jgi:hypothetical protein